MESSSIDKNRMLDQNQLISGDSVVAINGAMINSSITVNALPVEEYRKGYVKNSITKANEFFVKTELYARALNQLKLTNSIILVGRSGIGKTSLAYLICNYLINNDGYNFRFVRKPNGYNFENIRTLISENCDEKEVIVFDDFLGDSEFHLNKDEVTILEDLLTHLDELNNKKFIFTSRNTILNLAEVKYKKLESLVKLKLEKFNLDKLLFEADKVEFFLFYCKKNEIGDNIKTLINKKEWNIEKFNRIISHDNFTPFIIMKATQACKNSNPTDYATIILSNLDYPDIIWENEFNALDAPTRKYLNILYSLSNGGAVNWDVLDSCYTAYMKATDRLPNIPILELKNSIETLVTFDKDNVEFIHPSLLEYLSKKITFSDRENIIDSAIYLEQIERIDDTKERSYIKKLMVVNSAYKLPRIFDLQVLPITVKLHNNTSHNFYNTIHIQYLKYLYEFKIENVNHQSLIVQVLKEILKFDHFLFLFNAHIIIDVFGLNYDFSEIFDCDENLQLLFSYAGSSNIWNLIKLIINKDDRGYDFQKMDTYVQNRLMEILRDIGEEALASCIIDEVEEYVVNELENYDEGEEYQYDDISEAVRELILGDLDIEIGKKAIKDAINKHLIYNFDFECIDNLEESDYLDQIIENAVVDHLNRI